MGRERGGRYSERVIQCGTEVGVGEGGGCRLRRLPRSSLGSSNDYDLIWEEEGEETTGTSRREASRAPIVT